MPFPREATSKLGGIIYSARTFETNRATLKEDARASLEGSLEVFAAGAWAKDRVSARDRAGG